MEEDEADGDAGSTAPPAPAERGSAGTAETAGAVGRAPAGGLASSARSGSGSASRSWWVISCSGSRTTTPVPPREDGRKEIASPCLRASAPTTAKPSRVPAESVVRSSGSPETACSARRSQTSDSPSPPSSTVTASPACSSST